MNRITGSFDIHVVFLFLPLFYKTLAFIFPVPCFLRAVLHTFYLVQQLLQILVGVSIILFRNFSIHFHLKSIFDMLKYFIIVLPFSVNFSQEIMRLFSGSARPYANNSSSFSVNRLAFFVVLPFCLP